MSKPKVLAALDFEAPSGRRFHRYGMGVTVLSGRQVWWDHARRRWVDGNECDSCVEGYSSHAKPVRTLKAFRRHLRRHATELVECEVTWVNRFVGHDVTVRVSEGR